MRLGEGEKCDDLIFFNALPNSQHRFRTSFLPNQTNHRPREFAHLFTDKHLIIMKPLDDHYLRLSYFIFQ
jgi:hypothetical protein